MFFLVAPQIMPFDFGSEPLNDQEMAVVVCSATKGDLPLSIEWYFNGTPLKSNINGVLLTNTKRTSQLAIESVSHYNQGNYTCAVKNQAGTTNHTSELYVNGTKLELLILRFYIFCYLLSIISCRSPSTNHAL